MRSAFGLLESLIALVVFSGLILVCSQVFLAIQSDLKLSKESQKQQKSLTNAMLYLQNQFRYAFFSSITSSEIEYFEIHRDIFFSAQFNPLLDECVSNKIRRIDNVAFVAFLSPSLSIAKVIDQESQRMILDRKAECGAMIPLKTKRKIFLQNEVLFVDSYPLLQGVREFRIKQGDKEIGIKICTDFCLTYAFPSYEVFYAF